MTKLQIAKKVIKENYNDGRCGLYNTRNMAGDAMVTIYHYDRLTIDLCPHWEYFEVFGLTYSEFCKLKEFYESLK